MYLETRLAGTSLLTAAPAEAVQRLMLARTWDRCGRGAGGG